MAEHNTEDNAVAAGTPSRRTILRGAAAAAWTVPAISLMTAAPAHAASTELHVTASGAYASSGNNPTVVNYSLIVEVSGAQPAQNPTMTLSVPATAPHTTAPVFTAPAGWVLSGTAAQAGGAWIQTFRRGSQALGTENVSGTITFTDPASSPFNRWGGHGFTLDGTIHATNQISAVFVPGSVAAANASTLGATGGFGATKYVERWLDRGDTGKDAGVGDHRRAVSANPQLSGNTSITKITATVTMTTNAVGRWTLDVGAANRRVA